MEFEKFVYVSLFFFCHLFREELDRELASGIFFSIEMKPEMAYPSMRNKIKDY